MKKIKIRGQEYEKNEQNNETILTRYDTKSKIYIELKFNDNNDSQLIINNIQNKLIKVLSCINAS